MAKYLSIITNKKLILNCNIFLIYKNVSINIFIIAYIYIYYY